MYLGDYQKEFRRVLVNMREKCRLSESSVDSDDWALFQNALTVIQICGKLFQNALTVIQICGKLFKSALCAIQICDVHQELTECCVFQVTCC